ncbi:MAG: hypothetical protein JWS12_238 [Candidatus Saccharibacteria bacterium]|nr:hypothetical protein [Candidatus Saccharibacteria bacterium]
MDILKPMQELEAHSAHIGAIADAVIAEINAASKDELQAQVDAVPNIGNAASHLVDYYADGLEPLSDEEQGLWKDAFMIGLLTRHLLSTEEVPVPPPVLGSPPELPDFYGEVN